MNTSACDYAEECRFDPQCPIYAEICRHHEAQVIAAEANVSGDT